MAETEKLVDVFNEILAGKTEELGQIELQSIRQCSHKQTARRTAATVEQAKADALSSMGDDWAAVELVERRL